MQLHIKKSDSSLASQRELGVGHAELSKQIPRGMILVLLRGHHAFHGVQGFTPLILGWRWTISVE